MNLQSFSRPIAVVILVAALAPAVRAVNYDEASMPDLSGEPSAPTHITLDPGANKLIANAGAGDFDLVWITVPTGRTLDSLTLDSYGSFSQSFVGLQSGSTWTAGLDFDVDPTRLMGWAHFGVGGGAANVGQDMLIMMSTAPSSPGFTRPLGAGDYALLFQDTDVPVPFSVTFNVSSPPVPGDFDGDGRVDGDDLAKWIAEFGMEGALDGAAILDWQRNLGTGVDIAAVPEPASAILAAGLAVFLAVRRLPARRELSSTGLSVRDS